GMEGLAGGEPDGKTSAELVGGLTLARAICSEQVGQEYELYQALIAATPEQQKALNRYIALQTGECDFLAAAKAFRDGDWAQKLAPPAEAPDYDALARRTEEILRGAEEERAACETLDENPEQYPWDKDRYLRDAHEAYLRVLREAPAEERNTPAFRRFRKSVMEMPKLAQSPDARREMEREERRADSLAYRGDDLTEMARSFGLPAGEALAAADVKTWPISGSAEYQKMARALLAAMKEREQTGRYDPKHDKTIRDACVEYCLAKPTVRKTQSGRDRFNRALNLMMAVSQPDDPEIRDCFSRINAARGFRDLATGTHAKARDLDNYLTPDSFGFDLRHAQRETERVMRQRGEAGNNARTSFILAMKKLDRHVLESKQSEVSGALTVVRTEKTRLPAKDFVNQLQQKHSGAMADYAKSAAQGGGEAFSALTAKDSAARYMLAGQITKALYGQNDTVDVERVAELTDQAWQEYELDYRVPDAPMETFEQQKAMMKDLNELGRTWLESQKIELARPEPVAHPEPEKSIARESEKLTL
ncbi:MAG: hypothetical protein IJU66_09290, partial [Oscillospiraceae bacterium]|nr:hypothetical protein [Oscillospiraceae bacterium]